MILFTMKMLWVSFNVVLYSFYVHFYALRWLEKVLETSAYFSKTKSKITLIFLYVLEQSLIFNTYQKKKKSWISFFSAYLSVSTLISNFLTSR
jgi:hypothetical protein